MSTPADIVDPVPGAVPAPPGDDGGASIGRNAAFAFAAQMVTSLATGLLTLYLVRALGPKDFGVLAIAIGLGTVVLLPGDFGISNATARFVAEARGDWSLVGGLIRHALRLKLIASTLLAAGLFALAEPIAAGYGAPGLVWPLRGVAIAVFAQSFMALFTSLFEATQRLSFTLRIVSTEALVEAGSAATLVLLGGGAAGAAFGRAIGYTAGALVGFVLILRLVHLHNLRTGHAPGATRRIFGYGSALMVIDGAYAVLGPIDMLMLGALVSARAVGVFAAPIRFITFLHYPGLSIATAVAPRLARSPGHEPDTPALINALRWIMLVQTVLVAPTVVWAQPITKILLGDGYGRSADVLAALGLYTFLTGFAPLVSLSVNYLGQARRRMPIAVGTVIISVGLNAALIPTVGLLGAAISTSIAYLFYVLGHLWLCKSLLDVPLRPIGRDLIKCLAAALAMAAVLAAFGLSDLGPVEIVAGGILGFCAYLATLLLTKAVSVDELRQARGAVAGKFRRRRPAG